MQNVYSRSVGWKKYITEQAGHEKWKMKNENKFHLYYHKQNQNSKIPNLHLKMLKIILNKI